MKLQITLDVAMKYLLAKAIVGSDCCLGLLSKRKKDVSMLSDPERRRHAQVRR
jgi:hypothetical protein